MALGAVSAAPSEAAQVTLDTCRQLQLNCTRLDYSGTVTLESNVISLLSSELPALPGIVFNGNKAIATVEQSIIFDNLSGRLHDSGDTELTLPLSDAHNSLPNIFSGLFSEFSQAISLGSINLNGEVLDSQNQSLSSFDFSYNKVTDEVIIGGYDYNRIKPCLNGICMINGTGSITTNVALAFLYPSLHLPSSVLVSTGVNFNVTQTATPLDPPSVPSAPEPSFLLGSLLAGGGLLNAKRKQKK